MKGFFYHTQPYLRLCCGLFFFLFIATLCLTAGQASGAPITFNTALPVAKHDGIVRLQTKYIRSTGDSTTKDREISVLAVPLVLVYGVTSKVTLFGIIPYLDKELKVNTPKGRVSRGDTGAGDATFLGRYTLYQRDRRGETIRLSPFAAIKAPLGNDNERDGLGRLTQPLQLGSGSWDYTLGSIFTWQTLKWQVDASVSYRFNTRANAFRFGDEARLDISYQYRLFPRRLMSGLPAFVYAVLESNLSYKYKDKAGPTDDMDSGGTTWFLSPGIQYVTRQIVLEAALQVPIVQDLNGNALENDYVGILSVRVNF